MNYNHTCGNCYHYAYRVMVGKPDGKGPLGIPTHRLDNYIKMDLEEVGWEARTGFI